MKFIKWYVKRIPMFLALTIVLGVILGFIGSRIPGTEEMLCRHLYSSNVSTLPGNCTKYIIAQKRG